MRWLVSVLALACALPAGAAAQADACRLVESEFSERRMQGGSSTIFIQGPLLVTCAGGARLRAQQGTLYEASRELHLSGNVDFVDADRRLTSDRATYWSVTGRLHATGSVVFSDMAEGMTLRGPELEYFRAMAGRPEPQATATQRPHLTLLPRGRGGEPPPADAEPVEVDGDRMTMIGNDHYTAVGRVEIRRSDFQAFSHEARVDQVNHRIELRGNARVEGEQFDLTGEIIDMLTPDDRLERVIARRDAILSGDDLRLEATELQMFFADDLLQRMVARRTAETAPRPIATARGFRLEADSIDALLPSQKLEQVIAIGTARGESLDTANIPAGRITQTAPAGSLTDGERDWIHGDTVIGYFVQVEPASADTLEVAAGSSDAGESRENEVELDRLVALGSARSLYRVENERDGRRERPGLNYLVGEKIELSFTNGELTVADVSGLQHGLFLDPVEAPEDGEPGEDPDADPVEPEPTPGTAGAGSGHAETVTDPGP